MDHLRLRIPEALNIDSPTLADDFRNWKEQFEIYLVATGAEEKGNKVKSSILLNCAGPQIIAVCKNFEYGENEDKNNPTTLLSKIEKFCNPQQNVCIEAYKFWNLTWSSGSFDQFLNLLRKHANLCDFGNMTNRMIRDKIVFTVNEKLRQVLLRENNLTYDRAIQICRSYDVSNVQTQQMQENEHNVYKIRQKLTFSSLPADMINDCKFCGRDHKRGKLFCPAYGKTCAKCKGKGLNHFKIKCRTKIHVVQEEKDDPKQFQSQSDDDYLHSIQGGKERLTALFEVNNCSVRFQLDTGADVNTICKRYVKREQVQPCSHELTMWNKTTIKPAGIAVLKVKNLKTNIVTSVSFYVVNNNFNCLLGLQTLKVMDLITVNANLFIANVNDCDVFRGDLGRTTLTIDCSIKPKVLPPRKIPIAIRNDVERELNDLTAKGIISPINEPTDWVSQMAVVKKKNGSLRICIDPQPLNVALKREHFKLPVLDDILPDLRNAKIFTKLDVKHAFWHVKLDDESSKLTTMNTPFGRFRWNRLPFGLKVSSEIFQKRLSNALSGLNGTFAIADDIIVVGQGDTLDQAKVDHANNLTALRKRCVEQCILLNDDKIVTHQDSITFMGHIISAQGIQADPAKIAAIIDMPAPKDVAGVKRFCGMVQYLARFLPNLTDSLAPLHKLTRKEIFFSCPDSITKSKVAW